VAKETLDQGVVDEDDLEWSDEDADEIVESELSPGHQL